MRVYGFSSDVGPQCFLSRADRDRGLVALLRELGGPIPNLLQWEKNVPEDLIVQTAYDYLTANGEIEHE